MITPITYFTIFSLLATLFTALPRSAHATGTNDWAAHYTLFIDAPQAMQERLPTGIMQRASGREMHLSFGYQIPAANDRMSWNVSVQGKRDANNVEGAMDASVRVGAKISF